VDRAPFRAERKGAFLFYGNLRAMFGFGLTVLAEKDLAKN